MQPLTCEQAISGLVNILCNNGEIVASPEVRMFAYYAYKQYSASYRIHNNLDLPLRLNKILCTKFSEAPTDVDRLALGWMIVGCGTTHYLGRIAKSLAESGSTTYEYAIKAALGEERARMIQYGIVESTKNTLDETAAGSWYPTVALFSALTCSTYALPWEPLLRVFAKTAREYAAVLSFNEFCDKTSAFANARVNNRFFFPLNTFPDTDERQAMRNAKRLRQSDLWQEEFRKIYEG